MIDQVLNSEKNTQFPRFPVENTLKSFYKSKGKNEKKPMKTSIYSASTKFSLKKLDFFKKSRKFEKSLQFRFFLLQSQEKFA